MDHEDFDSSRRVMNRIGSDNYLPYVNVKQADASAFAGPPIIGLLVVGLLAPPQYTSVGMLMGFGLGVVAGTALVWSAPDHLTAVTWARDLLRYYCVEPDRSLSSSPASDAPAAEGAPTDWAPFSPDKSTQELTGIRRAWPGAGTVERQDGSMEAFIEVTPDNRDLAMEDEWEAAQQLGHQFASSERIDFDLTVHATTRPFPAEEMVATLDDRLGDDDVKNRPILEDLLREYRERRPAELQHVHKIHYYIGVEVAPVEAYHDQRTEPTPLERLAKLPVLGMLVTPLITRQKDLTDQELHERMLDRLAQRIEAVDDTLVRPQKGWTARRLSTIELFALCLDFWNGTEYARETEPKHVLSSVPYTAQQRREAGDDAPEVTAE